MATKKQANVKPDHPLENDPAVERGERLATSKDIARGGKTEGFVPGASEQPTDADTKPSGRGSSEKK